MSAMLPERWRESLEQLPGKLGNFLERWRPHRAVTESIGEELPSAFRFAGGPAIDVTETDRELIVRAEVPGLQKEDFTVELAGRRLTIKGEKNVARERKGGDGSYFSECRYGSFSRSINLPYNVDDKKIAADLKHGVLTLRLPKPETEWSRPRRIPVS